MDNRMKLIIMALALLLSACAPQPVPFEAGAVVATTQGCIDGRTRGGDC